MRINRFLYWLLLILWMGSESSAQNAQSRVWYFGNEAGLDFATNPPTPLTNSSMNAFEGCASIADPQGNLLFYTDGSMVWDRNHTPMPSGSGMNGNGGATQSAIIVPAPLNISKYYIFTVDTNGGPRGLQYSEVDMTLNGGNGDVSLKNVPLISPVTEKLTAVRHANGIDAWVIVHGWNNADFHVFSVTATGVNTTPITTNIGTVHGGTFQNSHGALKSSPNAQKLASAVRGLRECQVFDFNNTNGQISNPITLSFGPQIYGVEFSDDSRFVYVGTTTNPANIHQFDLNAGNPAAVVASNTIVATHPGFIGALQLGFDLKIYICQFQSTSLAVIQQPRLQGLACGFASNAQFLGGKLSQYGLPNFLQSFFITADFSYQDTCSGEPTRFTTIFAGPDSVRWNFDDPGSGPSNTSTQLNPQHIFAAGGSYDVELIVYSGSLTDTVTKTINILSSPDPDLGADVLACSGDQVTLDPGNFPAAAYSWSDNSTGSTLTITSSGTYWVEVEEDGCTGRDTLLAQFFDFPVLDFGPNQTLCEGDQVVLNAGNPGAIYLWQDGSTSQTYTVTSTGNYVVTVAYGPCPVTDNVFVVFDPVPVIGLGNDTTICKGNPLFLDATNPGATYIWQDGSTAPFFFAEDPGSYAVIATIGVCTASDTIVIDQQQKPEVFLGEDSILCAGQFVELNAYNYGAVYNWQDGSSDSNFVARATGQYYVSAVNQCGIDADSILLTFNICNCLVFLPNAFTPNADGKNDTYNYSVNCTDFTGRLEIWDRWGRLVFVSEDPEMGWNGRYQGVDAPEGVYGYVIRYTGFDNGRFAEVKDRGNFRLIR